MASITEDDSGGETRIVTKPRLPDRHYRYGVSRERTERLPREEGDNGMNTCEVCGKPCSPGASACRGCTAMAEMHKDAGWDHERIRRDYMVFGYHAGIHWD